MTVTTMLLIIGGVIGLLVLAWALAVAAGRGEIDERRDK